MFYAAGVDTDQLKTLADSGVKRAVLPLPPKSAGDVLPLLDEYAKLLG